MPHTMATKAKKTSTKRKKAPFVPAVRYLRYHIANSGTPTQETSHYCDLARDLSAINRRMMRQGRVYHVKKITVVSANTPNLSGRVSVSTIPDSWVARGAWKRGLHYHKLQTQSVVKHGGVKPGKWADFKVNMSYTASQATLIVPLDNGSQAVSLGEWNMATFESPDGTTSSDEYDVAMLGAHQGSAGTRAMVGLIQSYGESRTTVTSGPNTPSTASSDPFLNLFDAGTSADDRVALVDSENDTPPYSLTDYPGDNSNMSKPLVVQDGVLSDGRVVLAGFPALLGLLEFEISSAVPNDTFSVLVELSPGNYRGINADVI